MKNDKRKQSYLKQPKASIDWILNLLDQIPKYQLQQTNMKPMTVHSGFQECDQIIKQSLYTFSFKEDKFAQADFILYPNMLLMVQESVTYYLVLSTCNYTKKTIQYKEFQAQGFQLSNNTGFTYLFYESYVQQLNWEKQLKRFCKLQNFSQKFTLKEKLSIQNYFVCVKNKNNRLYTVQLIKYLKLSDQQYECIMNEVNILMCFKQQGLPQFYAIYQDSELMYLIYEYWNGDTLYKLLQSGLKLTQQIVAQVVFQIIKVARFLHQNNLYHGSFMPHNIIILRQQPQQSQHIVPMVQKESWKIIVINFQYRENCNQIIKVIPKAWMAPETNRSQFNKIDPIQCDVYQIGCLLHYLTFYQQPPKQLSFQKATENYTIDYHELQQKQTIQVSLIDLLSQLLDPDPFTRINLNSAIAHQWFVNCRLKSQVEKPQYLASLRTILELREQSSCDIVSARHPEQLHVTSSSEDVEEGDDNDNIHRIAKEQNNIGHFLNVMQITTFKVPSRSRNTYQIHFSQL